MSLTETWVQRTFSSIVLALSKSVSKLPLERQQVLTFEANAGKSILEPNKNFSQDSLALAKIVVALHSPLDINNNERSLGEVAADFYDCLVRGHVGDALKVSRCQG